MYRRLRLRRLAQPSLTVKLGAICLLMAASLLAIYTVAVSTLPSQAHLTNETLRLSEARRINQHADMLHDALHADLLRALLPGDPPGADARTAAKSLAMHAEQFRRDLASLQQLRLPADLAEQTERTVAAGRRYVDRVERTYETSLTNRQAALDAIPEFDSAFAEAELQLSEHTERLSQYGDQVHNNALGQYEQARHWVTVAGLLAVVLGWAGVAAIGQSIRRSLREVRDVAHAVASGQLDRRSQRQGTDEIGQLASSVDRMAESLQTMIERISQEAALGAYGATLARALDMAVDEPESSRVVTHAMAMASTDVAMELLLTDAHGQHLVHAAGHPTAGSPGCRVQTSSDCVAVRRAQTVSFADSRDLDACPRLRNRADGPVCAVCVPVTFMGRAMGVLHASAPVELAIEEPVVSRLALLGHQAGGRIGSMRAFAHSQLQASTDSLTHLPNRRSVEGWVRQSLADHQPFTLALCDIDHFKMLNDTHGHLAGDEALRCFADVARQLAGDGKLAGRWGGEEFVFVLDDADAPSAVEWSDRLRAALALALRERGLPPFTVSFGLVESRAADSLDALLRLGDRALYRAKANGRNRTEQAEASNQQPLPPAPGRPPTTSPDLKVVAQRP